MRLPDLNSSNFALPEIGNLGEGTSSIIIFVVIALIVFFVARKLIKWVVLLGVLYALIALVA